MEKKCQSHHFQLFKVEDLQFFRRYIIYYYKLECCKLEILEFWTQNKQSEVVILGSGKL